MTRPGPCRSAVVEGNQNDVLSLLVKQRSAVTSWKR
jgi:hypothetical protein